MKITVLGADGFLGRNLVVRLARQEGATITAFSRFTSLQGENIDSHPFHTLQNVNILSGDFYNKSDLETAVRDSDYVFHLISSTTPASSTKDPLIDIDTNIRTTVELLALCSKYKVKKIIFFSSGGAVYGNVDSDNIKETSPLAPVSPYGISKVTIEHYLEYFYQSYGLDYLTYRIANPYGPQQKIMGEQGVIPIFMHNIIERKPITIFGDGEMVRDYIYIDDLVEMVNAAFNKKTMHKVYNIGSGEGVSVNTLVDTLESSSDTVAIKIYKETPATFVSRNVLNIDRFKDEFGITPKTGLALGIERMWQYVRKIS